MNKTPNIITRYIHENFWIVLSFALAKPMAADLLNNQLIGELKYLNKSIHENAEVRADRALLELAVQIRALDDKGELSSFKGGQSPSLGVITFSNGKTERLSLREMTNKILHGASFEWNLDDRSDPKIFVHASKGQSWCHAEIKIFSMMAHVGQMMFD